MKKDLRETRKNGRESASLGSHDPSPEVATRITMDPFNHRLLTNDCIQSLLTLSPVRRTINSAQRSRERQFPPQFYHRTAAGMILSGFRNGFCYLSLIKPVNQQRVATELRAYPTVRALLPYIDLDDSTSGFRITIGNKGTALRVVHLLSTGGSMSVSLVKEVLRRFDTSFVWLIGGEDEPIVREAPACRCRTMPFRLDITSRASYVLHPDRIRPDSRGFEAFPGFCYLAMVVPERKAWAAAHTGPFPRVHEMRAVGEAQRRDGARFQAFDMGPYRNGRLVHIAQMTVGSTASDILDGLLDLDEIVPWYVGSSEATGPPEVDNKRRNRSVSFVGGRNQLPSLHQRSASANSLTRGGVLRRESLTIPEQAVPQIIEPAVPAQNTVTDTETLTFTINVAKASEKPTLSLETKSVPGQKELRPFSFQEAMTPAVSEYSNFLNDQPKTNSPYDDPLKDDPMSAGEQSLNDILDKSATTFGGIQLKMEQRKGWTQKEIIQAMQKTGMAPKHATPFKIPEVEARRDKINSATSCLYDALEPMLADTYHAVLDKKITRIGDMPWSMYRYASWLANDKRQDERYFLIKVSVTNGLITPGGTPSLEDHIQYIGTYKMIKNAGSTYLPLGIRPFGDMKERMTSDGTSLTMLMKGSEIFQMNPRECTIRKSIRFAHKSPFIRSHCIDCKGEGVAKAKSFRGKFNGQGHMKLYPTDSGLRCRRCRDDFVELQHEGHELNERLKNCSCDMMFRMEHEGTRYHQSSCPRLHIVGNLLWVEPDTPDQSVCDEEYCRPCEQGDFCEEHGDPSQCDCSQCDAGDRCIRTGEFSTPPAVCLTCSEPYRKTHSCPPVLRELQPFELDPELAVPELEFGDGSSSSDDDSAEELFDLRRSAFEMTPPSDVDRAIFQAQIAKLNQNIASAPVGSHQIVLLEEEPVKENDSRVIFEFIERERRLASERAIAMANLMSCFQRARRANAFKPVKTVLGEAIKRRSVKTDGRVVVLGWEDRKEIETRLAGHNQLKCDQIWDLIKPRTEQAVPVRTIVSANAGIQNWELPSGSKTYLQRLAIQKKLDEARDPFNHLAKATVVAQYTWSISGKLRNKRAHALNGNGPKWSYRLLTPDLRVFEGSSPAQRPTFWVEIPREPSGPILAGQLLTELGTRSAPASLIDVILEEAVPSQLFNLSKIGADDWLITPEDSPRRSVDDMPPPDKVNVIQFHGLKAQRNLEKAWAQIAILEAKDRQNTHRIFQLSAAQCEAPEDHAVLKRTERSKQDLELRLQASMQAKCPQPSDHGQLAELLTDRSREEPWKICGHAHEDFACPELCQEGCEHTPLSFPCDMVHCYDPQVHVDPNRAFSQWGMNADYYHPSPDLCAPCEKPHGPICPDVALHETAQSTISYLRKVNAELTGRLRHVTPPETGQAKASMKKRIAAAKSSVHAWHQESFKGPRDMHSRKAATVLSSLIADLDSDVPPLPPPNRVLVPNVVDRWWNKANLKLDVNGQYFNFHLAQKKLRYQTEAGFVDWDPSQERLGSPKSLVAHWSLLEYAFDHVRDPFKQKQLLEQLDMDLETLRKCARDTALLPYDSMTRRNYLRKWDRATTKPSDPGPIDNVLDNAMKLLHLLVPSPDKQVWKTWDPSSDNGKTWEHGGYRYGRHAMSPRQHHLDDELFSESLEVWDKIIDDIKRWLPSLVAFCSKFHSITVCAGGTGLFRSKLPESEALIIFSDIPFAAPGSNTLVVCPDPNVFAGRARACLRVLVPILVPGPRYYIVNGRLYPMGAFSEAVMPRIARDYPYGSIAMQGFWSAYLGATFINGDPFPFDRKLKALAHLLRGMDVYGPDETALMILGEPWPCHVAYPFQGRDVNYGHAPWTILPAGKTYVHLQAGTEVVEWRGGYNASILVDHLRVYNQAKALRDFGVPHFTELELDNAWTMSPSGRAYDWFAEYLRLLWQSSSQACYTGHIDIQTERLSWGKPWLNVLPFTPSGTTELNCQISRDGAAVCKMLKIPPITDRELIACSRDSFRVSKCNLPKRIVNRCGLPFVTFGLAMHNDETTLFRGVDREGIHHTNFCEFRQEPPPWLANLVQELTRLCAGKRVIVTANPNCKPPRKNRVCLNFGEEVAGWHTVSVPRMNGYGGRSLALWRLLALYVKAADVWIVNGRDTARQIQPKLITGRFHSANQHNAMPIILASTITDINFQPVCPSDDISSCTCSLDKNPCLRLFFGAMALYGQTYGIDEWFLHRQPLTSTHYHQLADNDYRMYPLSLEFPDTELIERGTTIWKGPLSRFLLLQPRAHGPEGTTLGFAGRTLRRRFDSWLADIPLVYLESPYAKPPTPRSETILMVVHGTRGDRVPVEYLARVLIKQGQKVVLWQTSSMDSHTLARLKNSDFSGQFVDFLAAAGCHKLGYKLVFTPHVSLSLSSIKYTLTNWSNTRTPSWLGNPLAHLSVLLMRSVGQGLIVGSTPGCNTPYSGDGLRSLLWSAPLSVTPAAQNRLPAAWVESSDGREAMPEAIRLKHPGITIPYDMSEFSKYKKVYTNGTQGTVNAIIAHGAEAIIVDAWFDQARTYHMEPRIFTECTFQALGDALWSRGVKTELPISWFWMRWRTWVPTQKRWYQYMAMGLAAFQYAYLLAPLAGTFPSLVRWVPNNVAVTQPVLRTLLNFPIIHYFLGVRSIAYLFIFWYILEQLPIMALGIKEGVVLRVSVERHWMPLKHAKIVHKKRDLMIEYGWFGERNLMTPFQGRLWKHVPECHNTEIEVPISIDFDALAKQCVHDVAAYGPFFNCQTQILTNIGNNAPAITLLCLGIFYAWTFVLAPWFLVIFIHHAGVKIAGRSPLQLITLGPQEDNIADIALGAALDEDDLPDEDAGHQPAVFQDDGTLASLSELPDEDLMRLALLAAVEEDPDAPEELHIEEAGRMLTAMQQELLDQVQVYEPIEGDTFSKWLDEFTSWCLMELRNKANTVPYLRDVVRLLLAVQDNFHRVLEPFFQALRGAFDSMVTVLADGSEAFIRFCHRLVDLLFTKQVTRKLKAAWFGAELLKPHKLSIQKRIRDNLSMAQVQMADNFDEQYALDTHTLRDEYSDEDVNWQKLNAMSDNNTSKKKFNHRGPKGFGGPTFTPVKLPRSLVLSHQELEVLANEAFKEGVDFNARADQYFTKRVDRLMSNGTPLATDGALLAAIRPSQAESSLIRYTHHGVQANDLLRTNVDPFPPELKSRLDAVGDALYRSAPEMLSNPKLTPPEAMLEWWRHRGMEKFNTTAPLNMASRAHAIADGQMAAILRDVYHKEKQGAYPSQYYAAKVKGQAVPVAPLVTPNADGLYKPVRTFVAQDSRSTAIDWTVGLELKNRLPGDHVGITSKMAAGQGYSNLFRRIRGKENIFMGDMGQYDSRLEREHFYMLDRALENGVSDKIVLSWLKAKHEAMQNSYIAVLSLPRGKELSPFLQHARASNRDGPKALPGYENWILKIRSGATGESSTAWTDSWTFRATFCLIVWDYCDYFSIPFSPDDFFNDSLMRLDNSGDDNMGHLDFLKKYGHVLNPQVMVACAKNRNMTLDFAVLDSFEKCEFLGCMAREPTAMDKKTLERVRALFHEVKVRPDLVRYATINPDLNDPNTLEAPEIVVYRNLTNSLVRQTATQMYGNVYKDDQYLEKWIAKYVGHLQLCAFKPTHHQDIMHEYLQTSIRWLYAATESPVRDQQGIVKLPVGQIYDDILACMNIQYEDVGKRVIYAKPLSRAPGNLMNSSAFNTEFRRRLLRLSQTPPAAYSKVIGIHMAYGKKPASFYEKKMHKIFSGLYPIDDAAKELLDTLRSVIGEASRKLIKGFTAQARDQMYLEDIYDSGHYYVESAIWLTYEEKIMSQEGYDVEDGVPEMSLSVWQGLCSKAAFGSITDPLRYFSLMQDNDFSVKVRTEPAATYRNMMWVLVLSYVLLWYVETRMYGIPVLGFLYALFMFSVIDMSKIYGLISMLYWLVNMDVHPTISSWMPRDPYVLAKRLSSWNLKFVPLCFARYLPFAHMGILLTDGLVMFSKFYNRLQSTKPLAGHGSPIDNPWTRDAHRMIEMLLNDKVTPDNAIVLSSETGTGKSSLGVDALTRMIKHEIAPTSRTWVFVPTRILLKDPLPGFLQRGQDSDHNESLHTYQVLRKGTQIRSNAEILFMTYGHGRNRLMSGEFQEGIDTAFVDEMHILSAEQRLVVNQLKGQRLIFSSATHVPPPGFTAPVFRSTQTKRWKAIQRIFPATTNVASMFQRARNDTEPMAGMKEAPAQLSDRTLILCSTFRELDEVAESLTTLRKSMFGGGIGVSLPPVVEISSRVKPGTEAWSQRQDAFVKGRYIALGTKQAATGMDIKPFPPRLLIDGGEDIYSHQGSILKLPTTQRDHEQRIGRVTRNSATGDGLVYCREQAGTRGWETMEYPSLSYLSEQVIASAYDLPMLFPIDTVLGVCPANNYWPYFSIVAGYENHIIEALTFIVFANASGVGARNMSSFYQRHWQNGFPLSDDYEWMETCMKRQGLRPNNTPPAWVSIEAVLNQRPIIWNTQRITGSIPLEVDGVTSMVRSNILYPVAGSYLPFEQAMQQRSKVLDHTTKESRSEDMSADLIVKLQKTVASLSNQLQSKEQTGRLNQPRTQSNRSSAQREKIRQDIAKQVEYVLQGVSVPNGAKRRRQDIIAKDLIERYKVRERVPQAPFDSSRQSVVTQTMDEDDGWGYCTADGTPLVVGGSGPNEGETPQMSCGHNAHSQGDHLISASFHVVKRGVAWTSTYEVQPTKQVLNRIIVMITDQDIDYVLQEIQSHGDNSEIRIDTQSGISRGSSSASKRRRLPDLLKMSKVDRSKLICNG
nr:MAG: polyprotein [Sclerotinia sclerotiorum hypovirus 2-WX]